jgi:tricorn protease interacting factor F2/3
LCSENITYARAVLHSPGCYSVRVVSYDLFIDLDFEQLKFKGRQAIKLRTEQNVVLNSVGLEISRAHSGGKSFGFRQNGENLIVESGPFDGVLEVEYSGSVPDSLAGIYRAPYDHTHIVTTHFEAAQARRMMPCVDRPDAKAEFKLTVRISGDLEAISNMPVESVKADGPKKIVEFQKTPQMSTYLLYLGVGKFELQTEKLGKTDIIVATIPGKARLGRFAQDEAKQAIQFFNSYYNLPYMLPKLHLVAVPEFAMGAMENWGAITFREVRLLVDANSGTKTRMQVSVAMAHELAHQWFGDLVTMKWWDDIWLNESFATFMSYKAVDSIHPEWRIWNNFFNGEPRAETLVGALSRDCLRNSHPIEVAVNSPDEIEQIFDAISYGKGAHVLRMVEAYIGEEAFRQGVQRYLSAHAYSNATGNDLWSTLEDVSGKQVRRIMSSWVQQVGYPVVTASLQDGRLSLRQERFLISGDSEGTTWPIPIIIEVNGQRKSVLMETVEESVDARDLKSLRVNPDRTGFYPVRYIGLDEFLWQSKLSPFDRWGIAFDAFLFLISGKMKFTEYLTMLKRFSKESDSLPAQEISDQLASLYAMIPSEIVEVSKEFHRFLIDSLQRNSDENSSILKGRAASRLTLIDDSYALQLKDEFADYARVPPDMRQAVALAYARTANDFDKLVQAYRDSKSDEDKVRLLTAMTAFSDIELVQRCLDFALSGEVKRQDIIAAVYAATEKRQARQLTWNWLQAHIEKLQELYHSTGTLSGVFLSLVPILGIGRVQEVEHFFEEHRMPEADMGIKAGLERLRAYDRFVRTTLEK